MKYLITNTQTIQVLQHEDGTLLLTKDGKSSIPDAGAFIRSAGGIDMLLSRCIDSEKSLSEIQQEMKAKKLEEIKKHSRFENARKEVYMDMLRERNEMVETDAIEVNDTVCYHGEMYIVTEIINAEWIRIEEMAPEDGEPLQTRVKLSSVTKE